MQTQMKMLMKTEWKIKMQIKMNIKTKKAKEDVMTIEKSKCKFK